MIEELKTRCGQPVIRTGGGAGRATEAQQRKIFRLTCELGWNDQPERLRGYIRRMCKADDVRFLTPQQASVVIDGLDCDARRRPGGTQGVSEGGG